MNDITVIMLQYEHQTFMQRSLDSLQAIKSWVDSIIIVQKDPNTPLPLKSWLEKTRIVDINDHLGKTLNKIVDLITTPYMLFLQNPDYVSADLYEILPTIMNRKRVITIPRNHRDITTYLPFLVPINVLRQHRFHSKWVWPFDGVVTPHWLSELDPSYITVKNNLVKQARKDNSPNMMVKQQFIQQIQRPRLNSHSSNITIVMANYNMGKYIDIAMTSCMGQNMLPYEVLVMDDGSTDDSRNKLSHWHDGQQIRVFQQQNRGKAVALNALLPYVTSDFILELDADDWLDPNAIHIIHQYIDVMTDDVAVMYGNWRKWQQQKHRKNVVCKGISKGKVVNNKNDLLGYRFPLGPRIYRTSALQKIGGFPVIPFAGGRLYEDVSVLMQLIKNYRLVYCDFTVYNVREHWESITKINQTKWHDFIRHLSDDEPPTF